MYEKMSTTKPPDPAQAKTTRRLADDKELHAVAPFGQDVHGVVEARLRLIDQRYTAGRRALVNVLVAAGHPVSIGDIAQGLPDLPRSSAYRHLVDLQGAGVVRRVTANDEFTRFELAEDLTEHHHHFLCTNCGKMSDVTPSPAFEETIARQVGSIAESQGFQPHGHRLDVMGLCATCH